MMMDAVHRGDPATDRTSGSEAVADLGAFALNGITTFDTADHYGPSEQLIGPPPLLLLPLQLLTDLQTSPVFYF